MIHFKVKYNSIHSDIATIRIRLRTLPISRYIRIKNKDRATEVINPRRELEKMRENVKRSVVKKVAKNRGTIPNVCGLTK